MKTTENRGLSVNEIIRKIEYFCNYQERCFKDVENKLNNFPLIPDAKEKIILHIIENKLVDEERFAKSFARGKHNYKNWGRNRIINELKLRDISKKNIDTALKEIDQDVYLENFDKLSIKIWESIKEKGQKRKKKFVDYLSRKGFENHLIFEKLNEFNNIK